MNIPFVTIPGDPGAAPSVPASRIPHPASRITIQALNAHLRTHPEPHTCLPDGTPLFLTASGIDLFERLTNSFLPQDFHEATILLWAATRSTQELEDMWTPAPPEDVEADAAALPIFRPGELIRRVIRWRDAVLPAGGRIQIQTLAMKLWEHEHATALQVDTASLPDVPEAEKKSPSAAPTGSSPSSTPSVPVTSPAGPSSSTAPDTAPSSPPTAHGSRLKASPPSPRKRNAAATK